MDVDLCLFTFNSLQDLEADKRNLGRLVARQERELAKYVSTEADLPVILRLGVHFEKKNTVLYIGRGIKIFLIFFTKLTIDPFIFFSKGSQ